MSEHVAHVVAESWARVGVIGHTVAVAPLPGEPADDLVAVSRFGGFAGLTRRAEVHLGQDPRTPEVEDLLTRIHPEQVHGAPSEPDRFVYSFWLCGRRVTVSERRLTPELARLAHLLLDE